ncbi:SET domain-containing protein-lysine N-methyltransferase [Candidatus Woesearchaeota archaeon]|nr:SET domain-containing protein-lysine N-methyltransferase [Candidatus Woesearchaeota archaeon]
MHFSIKQCRFGRGLFAAKDIAKGEHILTLTGKVITQEEVDNKPEKQQANALQIEYDFYMDLEEPGVLINHSCNPNTGIQKDKEVIAIRDIKAGEEMTWDYSTSVDGGWTMPCGCAEKNCRKKVKDFKVLPKKVKESYLQQNIVLSFIKEKYFL